MGYHTVRYQIESTGQGVPTLAVFDGYDKKSYLHSSVSPLKEDERYRQQLSDERFDTLIVLGIGLGYHLGALREQSTRFKKIVLIDVIDSIGDEIAQIESVAFLTRSDHILIAAGKPVEQIELILIREIDFSGMRGLSVLEHPASMRSFPEYYGAIKERIQRIINKKAADASTRKAFALSFLRNCILNCAHFSSAFPVSHLFGLFSGLPAIIAIPGPSSGIYLDALAEFQDRVFIITVDSGLPALAARNILPDFVISVDPQGYIQEHYLYSRPVPMIGIYSLSANHRVVSAHPGPHRFVSLNTHPVSQIIEGFFSDGIGSVDSRSGSVAGDALMAAIRFGFSAIGLVGFDFSFSNFEAYARGSAYQKRYAAFFQRRTSPVETQNFTYIMKSSRGYSVGSRFTRRSLVHYKQGVESLLQQHPGTAVVNINYMGLPIMGTEPADFDSFINKYCALRYEKRLICIDMTNNAQAIDSIVDPGLLAGVLRRADVSREIIAESLGANDERAWSMMQKLLARYDR